MWQIEHQQAVWKSRRLSALIDLTRPVLGLHRVRYGNDEWTDTNILQVSYPCGDPDAWDFIDDAYVREPDLIVAYRECAIALRTQLQWRVHELPGALVLFELTASVQTPSHDCDPRLRIATSLPGTVWHLQGGEMDDEWNLTQQSNIDHVAMRVATPGIVVLNSAGETSPCFGQAIPACDLVEAHLERNQAAQGSTLVQTYFADRLEKGVLRRVRVQAYASPNSQDIDAVLSTALQALHHAPPLVA